MVDGRPYPDFFVSNRMEKPGRGESQWEVWQVVKRALSTEWSAGYFNYPLRDAHNRFEYSPDIIVLHADLGIVVLTCREYTIEDIEEVSNENWLVNGVSDFPISEVESQLAQMQSQITGVRELMDLARTVPRVAAVALPNITQAEWREAGFPELNGAILFKSDLERQVFNDRLDAEGEGDSMSEDQFKTARRRISQGDILSADRNPISGDEKLDSKDEIYRAATWGFELHEQDKRQEQIGLHIPPGPQQIRGIAGSGKTTIMAKKAAIMHTERPDWDIVFTFNTRSLYQTIQDSIENFYSDLSGGREIEESLRIWHAWGQDPSRSGPREQSEGLYREIAEATGISPYRIIHNTMRTPSLEEHCKDLLKDENDIPQLYDAILIDEAQDFGPYFYQMCYKTLKKPKRLIWAYDEAQSLSKLSAPSPKHIFGEAFLKNNDIDLSGSYPGGVNKSFVMKQSYRTPREVLMAGHALGMGLYSDDGIVNTLTTKEDWDAIGYGVGEDIDFNNIGSEITVRRNRDLSPHPIQSHLDSGELIEKTFCKTFEREATKISKCVISDILDEGLAPEQIMIVCVGPYDYKDETTEIASNVRSERIAKKLNSLAEDELETDELAHFPSSGSRDEFWEKGKVTISRINRAKGNEAASVYVAGAEQVARSNWERILIESNDLTWRDNYVQIRNEIFVGVSRSEGWCHIFGVGDEDNSFLREISEVIEAVSKADPEFEFEVPDPSKMDGNITLDDTVPRKLTYFSGEV